MAKHQIIIGILANAGGVEKTTLAVHPAYEICKRGLKVALIDLDTQRALGVFCGLPSAEVENTVVRVFAKDFDENWSLVSAWNHPDLEIGQGHPATAQVASDLVIRRRGEYVLLDRFKSHPLRHDVVILDCPATVGIICESAVAVAIGILIPLQLEMKSVSGVADLAQWLIGCDSLKRESR